MHGHGTYTKCRRQGIELKFPSLSTIRLQWIKQSIFTTVKQESYKYRVLKKSPRTPEYLKGFKDSFGTHEQILAMI